MALFGKALLPDIDYEINKEFSNWEATDMSTPAKLSMERLLSQNEKDKKREKPWYVDIPFFQMGVVPEGTELKLKPIEPQVRGRFYGKTPEGAKQTFDEYYRKITDSQKKTLQDETKKKQAAKIVQASVASQQALQEDPQGHHQDIIRALTESENPVSLNTNESSPFAGLQVNSVEAPAQRVGKLSAENIAARKAATQTRKQAQKTALQTRKQEYKAAIQKAKKTPDNANENIGPLPQQTWTNKNINALSSQQAMATGAERSLQGPSSITNPMALQRNKLRAAQASKTAKVPTATRSINSKRLGSARGYASSKTKFGRRQTILAKDAEQNLNTQISTMFNGGERNNVTKKNFRQTITKV